MEIRVDMKPFSHKAMMERVRKALDAGKHRVQSAALPYRFTDGKLEVLLITSRDTGRWVLPKGWIEKGETLAQSAQREALEEAGIKGDISRKAIGSFFYNKVLDNGKTDRCEVFVFPLLVEKEAANWPEMDERVREWVKPKRAGKLVHEDELEKLIRKFAEDPKSLAA